MPDLPFAEGSGAYCSQTCRWVDEWSEPFVSFALPGDHICQECGTIIFADGRGLAMKDGRGRLVHAEHHQTSHYLAAAA
jgi:hypothetical protein